jgi:hypothetical protein
MKSSLAEVRGPARRIFWFIISLGVGLPWLVGIGIKLVLQARGKPTLPWSYFLSPPSSLFLLVPLTVWWASPYIVLAFLARSLLSASSFFQTVHTERLIIIFSGLLTGTLGTVNTFLIVFEEFDPVYVFVPLPVFHAIYIIIGLLVGSIIAGISVLVRRRNSRAI